MKNKSNIGYKTLREKEKLLVTSNFSCSHNVFLSCISLVHQNAALCGNGLSGGIHIGIAEKLEPNSLPHNGFPLDHATSYSLKELTWWVYQ